MSNAPSDEHRPDAKGTIGALTAGTIASVVVFAVSFGLRLAGQSDASNSVALVGVIVLLATPATALVTTAIEMRRAQSSAAALAVLVLVILAGATILALLTSR